MNDVRFTEDDELEYLRVYTDDGIDENSLRHVVADIAETLEIVVDGGQG